VVSAIQEYIRSTPDLEHHILRRHRTGTWQAVADEDRSFASIHEMPDSTRAAIASVRTAYETVRPHVVHAHSSFAGAFTRLALPRSSGTVYTPHAFAFTRQDIAPWKRAVFKAVERALAVNTRVIAGCSPYETQLGKRWLGEDRGVYVPNISGVDVDRQATAGRPTVVGMGRLVPQKDPDWFAQAVQGLDGVDITWIGSGEAEREERLRGRRIDVTGWLSREEANRRLAQASVYLHSAAWEGFPMTILEAVQIGVPVVMRDIPVMQDVPDSVKASSPQEATRMVADIVADPEQAEANLFVWRRYLADNNRQVQSERLRSAYSRATGHDFTAAAVERQAA